ncbi:sarcosine oxidase subunit delta [Defluviimonas sp. WL0050]|uniref:Sarcosine oxidase subunit delta n=1 Tax=Albidovulum litorale TaxID=2984134 RepID=A0ABT2ZR52_9RHOB|nr:sarcosine oxidase subunit delta [Defluviimonas sp. WL0050]MCV2873498.1 sarcosine oxidase subunit delta [Defluviimonas sp. WL0050]
MLLIDCPFCGPRNETEFTYGGPALAPRPADPGAVSDADWVDWVTVPPNPMGPVEERWWHSRGCGAWLTIRRHTVTHEITEVRLGR